MTSDALLFRCCDTRILQFHLMILFNMLSCQAIEIGETKISHPCSRSHFARGMRTLPYGILMARLVVLRCFFLIAPFCLAKEGNNSCLASTGVERLLKQGSRRSRKAEVQQENVLKGDWNEQPFPGQGRRIVSQSLMNQHIL